MANKDPVILVHGALGFGPKELEPLGLRYWGSALRVRPPDVGVYEASVGPISSAHDRACELAAQIKGAVVDYGEAHAREAAPDGRHQRYGCDFRDKGFVPNWSERHPVHLVGHSLGVPTIRCLQYLLAEDHWGWGSNARWIKSISSISGVCNGNSASYALGANERDGLIGDEASIANALFEVVKFYTGTVEFYREILKGGLLDRLYDRVYDRVYDSDRGDWGLRVDAVGRESFYEAIYDFSLEHWGLRREPGQPLPAYLNKIAESTFLKGKDNGLYSLTLQGAYEDNAKWKTYPETYYFSYITEQTFKGPVTGHYYPSPKMNPVMLSLSTYIGRKRFAQVPVPINGFTDEDWWENDGAVPTHSQKYPHTNGEHPVGDELDSERSLQWFQPGRWYYAWERDMDHLDIVAPHMLDVVASRKKGIMEQITSFSWRNFTALLPEDIASFLLMERRADRQDKFYANLFKRLASL
jgi:triacylglycerol esterase/lipase EstA (alpha/beta hydrolase family)